MNLILVGGCIPTPLKNMTSSIGMIRNSQYFWENKTWPNHQPVFNPHLWKLNFQWILVCCTVPWLSKFYVFFTSADPSVPGTPQVPSTWPGLRMVMTTLTTVMRIIIDEDDNYYSQLLFWHQYAIRVFVHNYCSWGSDIVNYDHYVFVNTTHIHIYIYIYTHSFMLHTIILPLEKLVPLEVRGFKLWPHPHWPDESPDSLVRRDQSTCAEYHHKKTKTPSQLCINNKIQYDISVHAHWYTHCQHKMAKYTCSPM